jgi:hypothetical protein
MDTINRAMVCLEVHYYIQILLDLSLGDILQQADKGPAPAKMKREWDDSDTVQGTPWLHPSLTIF